jgi:hypothetical protein
MKFTVLMVRITVHIYSTALYDFLRVYITMYVK